MASSENRLDAKSQKIYGENVNKPKIDKKLHEKGDAQQKVLDSGNWNDDDDLIDRILN